MKDLPASYKKEMETELEEILSYWINHTIDVEFGGFIGKMNHGDQIDPEAPKGSVLNSRILWAFSAAFNLKKEERYMRIAERAFSYLTTHFTDKKNGGLYWTVDHRGAPLETKNQIYALSFAIYGLSEYYKASLNEEAKKTAIDLYHKIITYSYDHIYGGYIEALTRDWKEIKDLRLSAKDANEKKSMNTHLHVLEGFANLHSIWPDEELRKKIHELIILFEDHIIDKKNNHLILFFTDSWEPRSSVFLTAMI